MLRSHVALVGVLAIAVSLAWPAIALADGSSLSETATITMREPGAVALIEHIERVEISGEDMTVVFEVGGAEHEVEVELTEGYDEMKARMLDEETDLVDLAALPVLGGIVFKSMGFLLRLGRL